MGRHTRARAERIERMEVSVALSEAVGFAFYPGYEESGLPPAMLPERCAEVMRVLLNELTRISEHATRSLADAEMIAALKAENLAYQEELCRLRIELDKLSHVPVWDEPENSTPPTKPLPDDYL